MCLKSIMKNIIPNNYVEFEYHDTKYFLNNEKAAQYHIDNSMDKLNNMVNLIDSSSKVILDIGANCGIFSALALKRIPSAKVYAFEPSKTLIPVIKKNCHQNKRFTVYDLAVGDKDQDQILYINNDSQQTNSLNRSAVEIFSHTLKEEVVKCVTLNKFLMEKNLMNVDTIKIDVQGFESHVFKGATKVIPNVQQIFVESTWMDIDSIYELIPFAYQYNFKYLYVVNSVYLGADILLSKKRCHSKEFYIKEICLTSTDDIKKWF